MQQALLRNQTFNITNVGYRMQQALLRNQTFNITNVGYRMQQDITNVGCNKHC